MKWKFIELSVILFLLEAVESPQEESSANRRPPSVGGHRYSASDASTSSSDNDVLVLERNVGKDWAPPERFSGAHRGMKGVEMASNL